MPTRIWSAILAISPAAIKACEAVDKELGRTAEALDEVGGLALVTADHGNCETMWDAQGQLPHTAHTTNPVPIFLFGAPDGVEGLRSGRLADVAPTLLDLMGIAAPPLWTGRACLSASRARVLAGTVKPQAQTQTELHSNSSAEDGRRMVA